MKDDTKQSSCFTFKADTLQFMVSALPTGHEGAPVKIYNEKQEQ